MQVTRADLASWGKVSATLLPGTAFSASLATILLDRGLHRPEAASVTTLVPGYAYSIAAIMKISLVCGLAALVWLGVQAVMRRLGGQPAHEPTQAGGLATIAAAPLAPLAGAVTVLVGQFLTFDTASWSRADLSQLSRIAVFVELVILGAGVALAGRALARRERPVSVALLGLGINAALIAFFCYFELYALGFDQDTWAPR